jgi:peptidoglycan hydrolase CwlO-like protein
MNYGSWTDEELRRALGTNPDDADATAEAGRRFTTVDEPDQNEIDELNRQIESLESENDDLRGSLRETQEDCDALEAELNELKERA